MSGRAAAPFWSAAEQPRGKEFPMAMAGTVKFFNAERRLRLHQARRRWPRRVRARTAVEQAGLKSLSEGQRLSFDVEPDKKGKGPKAVNLVITG